MTDDLRTALGEHAFFAEMDAHHLDILASLATWSDYSADSWIARAGEYPDSFHAIVSGRAGIEINTPGRAPLIVATVHAGGVIGWSWFFDRSWQFDVIALDDVRSIAIDARRLLDACGDSDGLRAEITVRLLQVVVSHLEATRHRLVDVYGHDR